jgi:4-hydroxy-tetrahydrodipicolinate reductase
MGKRIEQIATAEGHRISHRYHSGNANDLRAIKDTDVAIEFSNPEVAVENFKILFSKNIPTVSGTTGWYAQYDEVQSLAASHHARFMHATNFSIGVQLAFAANAYLAKLMESQPAYQSSVQEWHHKAKKDAPSGTAITFAEGIIKHNDRYENWELDGPEATKTIPVQAFRDDDIPGTHRIKYHSANDEIALEHKAYNRDGFVTGAIEAAKWLIKQSEGIYTMKDFLKL